MKLYWIVLMFVASLTAQKSSLLAGAEGTPVHEAAVSLSFQNPSPQSGGSPAAQTKASAGTARVDGIVRRQLTPNAPVVDALVKLFPDPVDPQHPELIRTARSDEWGNFRIENVVPGKYRIVAIMGHGPGPEDLKAEATIAAAGGTSVELSEKESKTLTLYLYSAAR